MIDHEGFSYFSSIKSGSKGGFPVITKYQRNIFMQMVTSFLEKVKKIVRQKQDR